MTYELKDFPLLWRWTEKEHSKLSASELSRITPIMADEAKKLWKRSLEFSDNGTEFRPSSKFFQDIEYIESPHERDDTNEWLRKKIQNHKDSVVWISWQPDLAVETDIEIFVTYWDSFCYEASDDTSIFPESEDWIIHFWHEDRLYHANKKTEPGS